MNIQLEKLEDHTARVTVEVDAQQLEKAKKTAARKIARKINVPGFRKGKAPYHIIANYVGEGAIIEDALEVLGNDVYKNVLDETDVDPFGPGQLEDVKLEEQPVFVFSIPLQPTVALNDYRSIRVDFDEPSIEDEDVDRNLRALQDREALVEESQKPVGIGNRITADIHAWLIDNVADESDDTDEEDEADADDPPEADEEIVDPADDAASDDADENDDDAHDIHEHLEDEKVIFHEHDAVVNLTEDNELSPGFNAALVGAIVGDNREFEVDYPDDKDEYEDLAGRKAKFAVTIKKIENVTLPELNDTFAARLTEDEDEPLTLLQLRMRLRENLQKMKEEQTREAYSAQVLDRMVEEADVHYPEAMVAEQVEDILRGFDQDLRRQGLTLEDFKKIYNKDDEALYDEYREMAANRVERSLVLRELVTAEQLEVSLEEFDEHVDEQVESLIENFGEENEENYREMFTQSHIISDVRNNLLTSKIFDRIVAIAKGEAPELTASENEAEVVAEADAEVVADSTASEDKGESVQE